MMHVVDGELAAFAEQVAERALPFGPFELIGFVDPDPGQLPALLAQRVQLVSHGALLGEQRFAGVEPCVSRNDLVGHHLSP